MAGLKTRTATLLAAAVAVVWLVAGGVAGPYAGRLSEVSTNDNAAFLPADAEATRAQQLAAEFNERETVPALVIYERATGITEADRQAVAADLAEFAAIDSVAGPLPPPIASSDGQALQVIVPIAEAEGEVITETVSSLRAALAGSPEGLEAHVAGPAGLLADLIDVFSSIDGPLLLVTLGVVLIILLVVYRSPVLWIVPMLSAVLSYGVAAFVVYQLASHEVVTLNGQAQGILTVLVFGAGTDYALLLIARYREELRHHESTVQAMIAAWRGAAPAIAASAATVILSLLCLLLSGLNSNRALGPVSAAGIAATLLVMLTFLPAMLLLGGRWIFWPRVPHGGDPEPTGGLWHRVAGMVSRHARRVWVLTSLALLALTLGLLALNARPLGQSDLFTQRTDSVAGQEAIGRHFAGGSGSPATIFTTPAAAEQVAAAARAVPGVAQVDVVTAQGRPAPGGAPKVVDGRVQLQATLAAAPDSEQADETVRALRDAVHAVPGAGAVVGGFTAINVDTSDAAERDRNLIIPVVLLVIAVVLALLLRSLLAPVLLIATVVLSFAATLGLCALLFKYVFGFPGVDTSLPLFAFVFLVALGIDYNIFLMSRVRQESLRHGTREGVRRGLIVTGAVITSAGIVLAATFSALAVLPLVVLVELGVAVAVGVLLDTTVVRSLLVPALAYDIGERIWWPSRLADRGEPAPSAAPDPVSSR